MEELLELRTHVQEHRYTEAILEGVAIEAFEGRYEADELALKVNQPKRERAALDLMDAYLSGTK